MGRVRIVLRIKYSVYPFNVQNRKKHSHIHFKGSNAGVLQSVSNSGWRSVVGCCEYGNEPSHSIKGRELLDS